MKLFWKSNVILYDHTSLTQISEVRKQDDHTVGDVQRRFIIRLVTVRWGGGKEETGPEKKENSTRTGGNEMQLSLCCAFDPEVD